jgi:phage N-6-adenine-methyltransferase
MTLPLFGADALDPTADRDCWATPPAFVRGVAAALGVIFALDVCAFPCNAKAPRFFTVADDGLWQSWATGPGAAAWCNPPYSKGGSVYREHAGIAAWATKAREEADRGHRSVLLVPSDLRSSDRRALSAADHAIPVLRRIAFEPPTGVQPSMPNFGVHLHLFGVFDSVPRYL